MSARGRRSLWLVPTASLLFGALSSILLAAVPADRLPPEDRFDVPDVLFALAFAGYAAVGALVAARHPRNAVAWLFCAVGVALPLTGLLWSYAVYSLYSASGGLPGEVAAAWGFAWSSDPLLILIVLLVLLFPNGRFLSSRWRRVGQVGVLSTALWALALALDPGPLYNFEAIDNPVGIDGAAAGALEALAAVTSTLDSLLFLAAGVSLVLRFRRAQAVERLQIKWLAAAGAFAMTMALVFTVLDAVTETERGTGEVVTSGVALLAIGVIPVGAGMAMLRHRLYEVDVVINRTLVYGALTATLLAAYLGLVLLLQLALSPLTEASDLAVAGSTLAVAALFRPLRARIQGLVDRRFYRSKYDVARTLESFGARLRDEIELDSLNAELCAVVADTMQPAHVSLWLRAPGGAR
jgi:hypothetical protein